MATKKIELEVDYIGGLGPLTVEEEKALSEYFKNQKKSSKLKPSPKKRSLHKKSKSTV
ncbi:MAG: hypothetical protein WCO02_16330 [Bacteroidota bacterium]